jgi:hypothetical protein
MRIAIDLAISLVIFNSPSCKISFGQKEQGFTAHPMIYDQLLLWINGATKELASRRALVSYSSYLHHPLLLLSLCADIKFFITNSSSKMSLVVKCTTGPCQFHLKQLKTFPKIITCFVVYQHNFYAK